MRSSPSTSSSPAHANANGRSPSANKRKHHETTTGGGDEQGTCPVPVAQEGSPPSGSTDRNKRRRPTTATPQEDFPNPTPPPERPVAHEEPVAVPAAVDHEPSRFPRIEAGRPGCQRSGWFDYEGVFPAGVVVLPPWLTEEYSELACTSLSLVFFASLGPACSLGVLSFFVVSSRPVLYFVPLECADV